MLNHCALYQCIVLLLSIVCCILMIVNLSAKPIRKATKSPQVTISPYPTKQSKPNQASADISHGSSAKPSICTVDKEMYTNQATAFTCE